VGGRRSSWRRRSSAQRQFVANASHELRTPLARLKTLAQVALADPNASVESLRAAHDRVLASEQQLEQLIDALLSIAGSERGLERRQPVDLAGLAGAVLEERTGEIERRGLRLQTALDPARIQGDPQLLERLVANLIDNAIRHNVAGGSIEVSTTTTAGGGRLSVTNDGPVIPAEELERLQAPFERLGAARTGPADGHGLGLSIVHAIVAAHMAQLTIGARPEGGLAVEARFTPNV
jgi:signal transduction histidine kinase